MRSISIDYTVFRLVPSKQHLISTNSHEPMLDTKHFLFIFDVWPIVGTKNHTEHTPVSALRIKKMIPIQYERVCGDDAPLMGNHYSRP